MLVSCYAKVGNSWTVIGSARLLANPAGNGAADLNRSIHGHELSPNLVAITEFKCVPAHTSVPYEYTFKSIEDMPPSLGDIHHSDVMAWDERALKAAGPSVCPTSPAQPAISSGKAVTTSKSATESANRSEEDVEEGMVPATTGAGDDEGVSVDVAMFSEADYNREEIRLHIDQIVDPDISLRDISETHTQALLESMLFSGLDYSQGFVTVTPVWKTPAEFKETAVETVGGVVSLREGEVVEIVDGRHRTTILKANKKRPGMEWASEPIRVIVITRKDGDPLSTHEKLKISRLSNNKAGMSRQDTAMTDILKSVMVYAKTWESSYEVSFVDATTADIYQDMKPSKWFGDKSPETYKKYIRVGKLIVGFDKALSTLEELGESDGTVLGMVHLDDATLITSPKLFVPYLLRAADNFVRQRERAVWNARAFYKNARDVLDTLHGIYMSEMGDDETLTRFSAFMDTQVRNTATTTVSINTLFLSNTRLFRHNPKDTAGKEQDKAEKRVERLKAKVRKHFSTPSQGPVDSNWRGVIGGPSPVQPSKRSRDSGPPIVISSDDEPPKTRPRRASVKARMSAARPAALASSSKDKQGTASTSKDKQGKVSTSKDNQVEEESEEAIDPAPVPTATAAVDSIPEHTYDDRVPQQLPAAVEEGAREQANEIPDATRAFARNLRLPPSLRDTTIIDSVAHPRSLLSALLIPKEHRANLYITKEEVMALGDLAWDFAMKANVKREGSAEQRVSGEGDGMAYFARARAEVEHRGFTILEGCADPAELGNAEKAKKIAHWQSWSLLVRNVAATFPDDDRDPSKMLWTSIANRAIAHVDERARLQGKGRFQSTRYSMMEELETGANKWMSVRRAVQDVWIGWLSTLMGLDDGTLGLVFPSTGGRFLLNTEGVKEQVCHNDFVVSKEGLPGYFMITTEEETGLLVCEGSQRFVFYPKEDQAKLVKALFLEPIMIPPRSIFVGHGYLQHAGERYTGSACCRYHLYCRPVDQPIPNQIIFGLNNCLRVKRGLSSNATKSSSLVRGKKTVKTSGVVQDEQGGVAEGKGRMTQTHVDLDSDEGEGEVIGGNAPMEIPDDE